MKKIITALANPRLNEEIKNENEKFIVMGKDIYYKEGIFEILEKDANIDFLILSELIIEKSEIDEVIEKIKLLNQKIKIIIILQNHDEEKEKYLIKKGIEKIFYNNDTKIEEIIEYLKSDRNNDINNLNEEIEKLKIIIKEKEGNINKKISIFNIIKLNKIKNKIIKDKRLNNIKNKIISVCGVGGVGKSITTVLISHYLKNKGNKILIIDFDILNNDLHTILGIKKYEEKIKNKMKKYKEINLQELIINVNKNIELISGINLIFNNNEKININLFNSMLNKLKKNYDYIIVDTSSDCFFEYNKNILNLSNVNIFLIEPNLLEIKKAKKLLELYEKQWKINFKKINIVFNKCNRYSINNIILKVLFSKFEILGKIKLNEYYNLLINKNIKIINFNLEIKKQYEKIIKKLIQI